MSIEINRISSWKDVLNSARFTVNKTDIENEPSTDFKNSILMSQHSPIRSLIFEVTIRGIKCWVSQHIARHDAFASHETHYVGTSREDINEAVIDRDEMKQSALVNHRIMLNAEDFINISRKRLCNKAHRDTVGVWRAVLNHLSEIEPEIASKCVPECVYRGFCPYKTTCGYFTTKNFDNSLKSYRDGM